jgi:hypothetical protein
VCVCACVCVCVFVTRVVGGSSGSGHIDVGQPVVQAMTATLDDNGDGAHGGGSSSFTYHTPRTTLPASARR